MGMPVTLLIRHAMGDAARPAVVIATGLGRILSTMTAVTT